VGEEHFSANVCKKRFQNQLQLQLKTELLLNHSSNTESVIRKTIPQNSWKQIHSDPTGICSCFKLHLKYLSNDFLKSINYKSTLANSIARFLSNLDPCRQCQAFSRALTQKPKRGNVNSIQFLLSYRNLHQPHEKLRKSLESLSNTLHGKSDHNVLYREQIPRISPIYSSQASFLIKARKFFNSTIFGGTLNQIEFEATQSDSA
jgi:hypothetical protein